MKGKYKRKTVKKEEKMRRKKRNPVLNLLRILIIII